MCYIDIGKSPAYMIGKVPTETEEHYDRSLGHNSSNDYDDPEDSVATASSRMYTPTSHLQKMVEKFMEGEDILEGKKRKKSAA